MRQSLFAVACLLTWSASAQIQPSETAILSPDYGAAEAAPNVHPSAPIMESKVLWDLQLAADASTINGSIGQAGIAFVNGQIWTSKWASDTILRFTAAGTYIDRFTIPGVTGVRSITTNGTNVYVGNNTNTINIINPGTLTMTGSITSAAPGITSRFLTYDATLNGGAGGFWTGNFNTDIVAISMTGAVLSTIPAATHTLTGMYGAAVDNINPGGPYLWVYHQGGANTSQLTVLSLTSGTPTVHTHDVFTEMSSQLGSTSNLAGGAFFTNQLIPGQLSIMTMGQGTPANGIIVYDAALPASVSDVAATSLRSTEGYTKIPNAQIFGETFVGGYQNLGSSTVAEINGEFNFYYNSSLIGTETFQALNVASNGTGTFTSSPFPMTNGVGNYEVTLTITPDAGTIDGNGSNDMLSFAFEVTDSIYARDDNSATGSGYTVSTTDSAYAVSLFEVNAADMLTGIWIQLDLMTDGDSTFGLVFDATGGNVGAEVARGTLQLINSGQNTYYLTFPNGVNLNPGTYAFGVYEGVGVGINLSQSTAVYTAGVNFFNVGGTWTPSGIQTARFIRPVFGTTAILGLNETAANELSVFPNPSNGKMNLAFAQELSEEAQLTVVDLNGRTVYAQAITAGTQALTFEMKGVNAGTYILNVVSGANTMVRTISLQ